VALRKDLENAGANWIDKEVVRDGSFITSRKPDDLEAFSEELLSALGSLDAGNRSGSGGL